MLTTKNAFEKASTSSLLFLASKNPQISANDNLQFFPGMNTLVGLEVSILPHVKTVVKIYKRIIIFPTEKWCSPTRVSDKTLGDRVTNCLNSLERKTSKGIFDAYTKLHACQRED